MPSPSVVYQFEVLDPLLELTRSSDVTAHLSVAVEGLREHFALEKKTVRVEVRRASEGELEGLGFFDHATGDLLAHITAFYLDREDDKTVPPEVAQALRYPQTLRQELQKLFA